MTERIDLRAIDNADPGREDRVIAATMSRIAESPQQYPRDLLLEWTERFTRPALVAAAVLAAIALGTVTLTRSHESQAPQVVALASWVETQHVPTNGELLLAFQGYRR